MLARHDGPPLVLLSTSAWPINFMQGHLFKNHLSLVYGKVLQTCLRALKKKKKYTTQTVEGSDLVCRFWCPISTFADVSFVMAFHRENVFSGVGGIWMPYIIQRTTEQPIRKVIYFSQRKCCFCNAQVSKWRCPGFVSLCAPAQMAGDDTAMNMYGGGDETQAV